MFLLAIKFFGGSPELNIIVFSVETGFLRGGRWMSSSVFRL